MIRQVIPFERRMIRCPCDWWSSLSFILILFFSLVGSTSTNAQTGFDSVGWCPKGATWVYEGHFGKTLRAQYTRDTVLLGDSAKLIEFGEREPDDPSPGFRPLVTIPFKERGDSVFWYTDTAFLFPSGDIIESQWIFGYRLTARVGDTWLYKNPFSEGCSLVDTVTVVYKDTALHDGRAFEQLYLSSAIGYHYPNRSVIRGIGLRSVLPYAVNPLADYCRTLPQEYLSIDWPMMGVLNCYSDSIRGTIRFNDQSANCNSIFLSLDTDLFRDDAVYPNPTTRPECMIRLPNGSSVRTGGIRVFSFIGEPMDTKAAVVSPEGVVRVSLPDQAGIYFILLENEQGTSLHKVVYHD